MEKNAIITEQERKERRIQQWVTFGSIAIITFMTMLFIINPAFAVEGEDTVKDILNSMIGVIGLVFQAVGVILAVYSVAQLVLAIKNEDADSKTRATTMLVVAIILIAIPSIIKGLGLVDKIGGTEAS